MVGELLKVYPQTGTINFEITENSDVFNDLIVDLKKLIKKHSDQGILPIECLYLNKNALNSIIGNIPAQNKHFTLKRKPKSAALRAELLQKSTDAATNVKKGVIGGSIPIRHRSGSKDLSDATPLKGIPSRLYGLSSAARTPVISSKMGIGAGRAPTRPSMPGVRRDGGIKLLDITEQPLGPDAKRKKRTQDHSEMATKPTKESDKSSVQVDTNVTPDYAAGLMSFVPPSPAPAYLPSSSHAGPSSVGATITSAASSMAVGLKTLPVPAQSFTSNNDT
jgi:negative elongation factor A